MSNLQAVSNKVIVEDFLRRGRHDVAQLESEEVGAVSKGAEYVGHLEFVGVGVPLGSTTDDHK